MALVNMKTVLLYDSRRVQPDLLKQIQEVIDGERDCVALACDPGAMDSFTSLTIFEPLPDELMDKLEASHPGSKKKAARKKKAANK